MCPTSTTLSQPLQFMCQCKAELARKSESVVFQTSLSNH